MYVIALFESNHGAKGRRNKNDPTAFADMGEPMGIMPFRPPMGL